MLISETLAKTSLLPNTPRTTKTGNKKLYTVIGYVPRAKYLVIWSVSPEGLIQEVEADTQVANSTQQIMDAQRVCITCVLIYT